MEISKESLENLLERTGLNGITEVLLPHLRKMERRHKEQKNPPKYMSEFCGRLSGLSTLFQTNFFRLFFRYCTGV